MICLTQPGRLLPFQTLDLLFLSLWVSAGCQRQSDAKQMKANLSASCISDITGGSAQFQMPSSFLLSLSENSDQI